MIHFIPFRCNDSAALVLSYRFCEQHQSLLGTTPQRYGCISIQSPLGISSFPSCYHAVQKGSRFHPVVQSQNNDAKVRKGLPQKENGVFPRFSARQIVAVQAHQHVRASQAQCGDGRWILPELLVVEIQGVLQRAGQDPVPARHGGIDPQGILCHQKRIDDHNFGEFQSRVKPQTLVSVPSRNQQQRPRNKILPSLLGTRYDPGVGPDFHHRGGSWGGGGGCCRCRCRCFQPGSGQGCDVLLAVPDLARTRSEINFVFVFPLRDVLGTGALVPNQPRNTAVAFSADRIPPESGFGTRDRHDAPDRILRIDPARGFQIGLGILRAVHEIPQRGKGPHPSVLGESIRCPIQQIGVVDAKVDPPVLGRLQRGGVFPDRKGNPPVQIVQVYHLKSPFVTLLLELFDGFRDSLVVAVAGSVVARVVKADHGPVTQQTAVLVKVLPALLETVIGIDVQVIDREGSLLVHRSKDLLVGIIGQPKDVANVGELTTHGSVFVFGVKGGSPPRRCQVRIDQVELVHAVLVGHHPTRPQVSLRLFEHPGDKPTSRSEDHNGFGPKGVGHGVIQHPGAQKRQVIGPVALGPGGFPQQGVSDQIRVQ
mmetsp:Transcript_18191/g.50641  ORF Transcript_18191/g.50641 Transcript_18191/m.50641 type:complete len:594 (-) Transcript_18191:627-2408(-)